MSKDQQALKYAQDMVMDAFDDAVLNVPGATKAERIVALVDVLLPRLIDRAAEAGAVDANDDLDSAQKAAFMRLLRKSIEETKGCKAALLVRLTEEGKVLVAGASTGMQDEFLQKLGGVLKSATYGFASLVAATKGCECPSCKAARSQDAPVKGVPMSFTGPQAQA